MRPSFNPRLVNEPFDDPGLFVPFLFEKRAFLFDAGDIHALSSRDILKISHVFITHTHMDHFIGFDRLLRLMLGRDKDLYLYGPEGIIENVEGKLSAYSWNLVSHYEHSLVLHVNEVRPDVMTTRRFYCKNRFLPDSDTKVRAFDGTLFKEPSLNVCSAIFDHYIPCLGFCLKERFHVNIIKEKLETAGLLPGPWLSEFKNALYEKKDPDSLFTVSLNENKFKKGFVLKDLADQIAIITPGQKITYISDAGFTPQNIEKMIELARDSDYLFIEAAFLEQDRELALEKRHLTAHQAGSIAAAAKVKRYSLFHYSPRYDKTEHLINEEARRAFENVNMKGVDILSV
ncbi:MBL fold metallo-hydrolase [Desulfobacterales bacterium HSG16]|nr:MBL fold metallo-hydrolase [Desulfobacterales bacterium HSG16]